MVLMIMALIFLVNEWGSLVTQGKVVLLVVIGIFAFMFSFRRAQRIQAEKEYERYLESEENESIDNAESI